MQRQRGELVPIAEVIAALPGPVQAFREAEPPARRGFTVADQVHQLVSASEADPERGFMARLMVLCSLPRTNPGNRHQYKRVNGPSRYDIVSRLSHSSKVSSMATIRSAAVCQVDGGLVDGIELADPDSCS